ncbi:hypothetical protein Pcinc_014155 [Petrolisthes cinctipes]|uniref:Uncharacterized protein n=1 Tax=Petrolisthes cinctipes TaxID=88211 RepID=A0AAE1KQX8_PETCI|nr:hypothetical protein Pcinc_014155 [Petrolisthes cinctipes]
MTTYTEVHLAQDLLQRRKLGAMLCALPKIQSSSSHRNRPRSLPPTTEAFCSYSHGCCGTPSSFRRTSLLAHHYRSLHQMARSHPHGQRNVYFMRLLPVVRLDLQIRHS